jgi:hypothetical protein
MTSNDTGFSGRSAFTSVDNPTDGSSRFGHAARLQLVRDVVGESEASLARARAAMARVEREIDQLWRDSMKAHDPAMSQRLAELSHALRRDTHLLQIDDDAIG